MAPRRCCCQRPGCELGADDFNRADSDDPGIGWRIVSGTGEIVSNRIVVDGVVATTICHPPAYPLGSYVAEMMLIGISDASVSFWEVWIGDPSDPSYRVEVSHNSGTNQATLSLYAGLVLIHAETYSGVTANARLRVCYVPGMMVTVTMDNQNPFIDSCDVSVGARCFAITGGPDVGGFAFREGTFDDWEYVVHFIENQTCPLCSCFCWANKDDYACLPGTLTLTFESVGADYAEIDDIILYQSFGSPATPWPNKTGGWNSDVVDCDSPVPGILFAFRFNCGTPIDEMNLQPLSSSYSDELGGQSVWTWASGSSPDNSARKAIAEDSTCDPLSIVFPEIRLKSAFPGPDCDFGLFPFGGHQPYCGSRRDECFSSPPDMRFIPRIII
jgi:hypothetical protein